MRNNIHTRQPQQGMGLVEVLVSILVLSVGLLAISKLHGLLIRDGGTANNHAIAVSLAQEKLDDLRGFRYISTTTSNTLGCGQGIFCYDEIASAPILPATTSISSNAGGHEGGVNGALTLPSGSVTVGNTTFTRNWQAVRQNGFTVVTATVTWTDQNGVGTESLTTSIMADDANITAMAANGPGASPPGPKVAYQPKGVPDVVPLTISTGTSRETSRPLPDVSSKGLSVSSQFSSVNYDADGEQIQEDFVTLNCSCQFAASASANPAAYFTYDKGSLVVKYPKTSAEKVNKITGVAITSQGDSQDPLCNTCCADHHDSENASVTSNATTALFDPQRPSGDYESNGDHNHYYYTNASQPKLGLSRVTPTSGNDYLEACRFLRVDGIYRIMQDWRLSDVAVMPKDGYLVDGSTALTNYKAYAESVVKGQAKTDGGTNTSWDKSGLSTRALTERSAGPIQLLARGIYVDRVYSGPRTLDATYYSGITATTPTIGLDKIPFNEVNVTLLASWASSNTGVVTVTNEEIKDITSATSNYYGVYNRGRANVVSGNGGSANVTAYVLPSNSGLTGGTTRATYASTVDYDGTTLASPGTIGYDSEIGIDRHDHASALRKSDAINIARTGSTSAGSRNVTGVLEIGNSSGDLSKVSVSSCTVSSATGNSTTFSCSVSDTFVGDLTLGTSQTGGSLSRTICQITLGTTDVDCGSYSVYGPTIQIRGTCNGNRCNSNDLVITASGTGATCTKDRNNPYCTVPLDNTGKWSGTITLSGVQKMDIKSSTTGASCTTNGTNSITFSTQGPADQPSAFNMCATN